MSERYLLEVFSGTRSIYREYFDASGLGRQAVSKTWPTHASVSQIVVRPVGKTEPEIPMGKDYVALIHEAQDSSAYDAGFEAGMRAEQQRAKAARSSVMPPLDLDRQPSAVEVGGIRVEYEAKPEPGACDRPGCPVLHDDPARPIHPVFGEYGKVTHVSVGGEKIPYDEWQRRESDARAEAEAQFRVQHPTTSSDLPEPEPLTLEQRVALLEDRMDNVAATSRRAFEAASNAGRGMDGR